MDEAANLSSCTARNPDREIGNGKPLQWTPLYGNGVAALMVVVVVPVVASEKSGERTRKGKKREVLLLSVRLSIILTIPSTLRASLFVLHSRLLLRGPGYL